MLREAASLMTAFDGSTVQAVGRDAVAARLKPYLISSPQDDLLNFYRDMNSALEQYRGSRKPIA